MGLFGLFSKKSEEPPLPVIKPKILVIDDEQYLRDFYQELLEGEGYAVITAANGKDGVALAISDKPQAILLDLMMPVMTGQEVLRVLWDNPETKKIRVIVLTNAGSIDNMDHAKFFSAYKFFIKSNVAPEEIIRTVAEIVPVEKPVAA